MKTYELLETISITTNWVDKSKPIITTAYVRRYSGSAEIEIVITRDGGCGTIGESMEQNILKSLIEHYTEGAKLHSYTLTISIGINSGLNSLIRTLGFELYESNENNIVYKVKA